jgi:dephospho-CoA kinase
MIVLGLTGSIAMGKSTVAAMFEDADVPVHDADAAVQHFMASGGPAFDAITTTFEGITDQNGQINRQVLGRIVFEDPEKRSQLEDILHPLVREDRQRWLENLKKKGADLVVLDIPLLFETGAAEECDAIVVVSATAFQQKKRAMHRPGMTAKKFVAILEAQMPNAEKCRRADYIIPTSFGKTASRWYVDRLIRKLRRKNDNA